MSESMEMDTAGRDTEAAREEGEERYLDAADLRKTIAEIDLQLHQNGMYVGKEQDPETGESKQVEYGPGEAQKLKDKLTLEAERLEGYPWSERSHKGFFAVVAGIIRAVKYAVNPVYRDQVNQMRHSEINQNFREAAESLEKDKKEPSPFSQEPVVKQETRSTLTQEQKREIPSFTEAEAAKLEEIRQNIHALNASDPAEITPAVAKEEMRRLKNQKFEEAKEAGKGDNWWKKESWYAGLNIIKEHPVLAHGLTEREAPGYAANLLLRSPKNVEFFSEASLRAAVPKFLEKAEQDPKFGLEKHLSWIERDAKQVPALNVVLDEIAKVRTPQEISQDMTPAEPVPEPVPEAPVFEAAPPAQDSPVMFGMDDSFLNPGFDMLNPGVPAPQDYEEEIAVDLDSQNPSWMDLPEFAPAIQIFYQENEFARFTMDPETLKTEILARNPELLRELPQEEMTYQAVFAASVNNLSVLKYVPENIEFTTDDGRLLSMNDMRNALREEMPAVARHLVQETGMTMEEAVDTICRDPKSEDKRAAADRKDVSKLKNKIRSDFEKHPEEWKMEPVLGKEGIEFV